MFSNNVFNRCEWLSTQWHKKGTKDYDLNWSTTWSEARLEITIDVRFNSFKGFFRKRIIERKLFEMSRKVEVLGWLRYKYWTFHQIWHFEILYLYKNIVMLSFIEWTKFHLQNITEKNPHILQLSKIYSFTLMKLFTDIFQIIKVDKWIVLVAIQKVLFTLR